MRDAVFIALGPSLESAARHGLDLKLPHPRDYPGLVPLSNRSASHAESFGQLRLRRFKGLEDFGNLHGPQAYQPKPRLCLVFCGFWASVRLMTYPERLLAAMEARKVRPVDLARELGVTRAAITHFKTYQAQGKDYALSVGLSIKAARFLKVSHNWLALGEGQMGTEGDAAREALSARAVYIGEVFDRIEGQAARDRAYAMVIQLLEFSALPRESEPAQMPTAGQARIR